jgi:magnesium transporter
MTDVNYYYINASGEIATQSSLEEALAAVRQGGFLWLDYCHPTREELSVLIEPLGLHPLAIEDCTDEEQIPKVEDYPNHTFLLFNGFQYVNQDISIYELDMFIGANFLVTVGMCNIGSTTYLKEVERSAKSEHGLQGPAFLAHVLLDLVVDHKFVALEALEDELNTAEETILDGITGFNPAVLLNLRRDLLAVRKSLFHEREILMKISRSDFRFITNHVLLYFRDIYDHLAKFFELTESYRDIVTSLMEMYLTILNNQMSKASNDMNATVKRLTVITTIFMPLTLLAGIGGMSEYSAITGGAQNWPVSYSLFIIAMVIIGILNYIWIRWLERRGKN